MRLSSRCGIRRSVLLLAVLTIPMPVMGITYERQSSGNWSDGNGWDPFGFPGEDSQRLDTAMIAPFGSSLTVSLDIPLNLLGSVILNAGPNSSPYPNAVHGATLITSTTGCGLNANFVGIGYQVVYDGEPPQPYYGYGHLVQNNANVTNNIYSITIAASGYSTGAYTLNNGTLNSTTVNVGWNGVGKFEQTGGTVNIGTSTTAGLLQLGQGTASWRGDYTLGGSGSILRIYGHEKVDSTSHFVQSGGTHEVKVSSGSIDGNGSLVVNNKYELSGGSLSVASNMWVDGSPSNGEGLTVSGGSATVAGNMQIGSASGVRQTGGSVHVDGNVRVEGSYKLGTESIAASSASLDLASMNIQSGNGTTNGLVLLNPGDSNSATITSLDDNSGQFTLMSGRLYGSTHKHSGTFTWNKGTLSVPSSNLTDFNNGGVIIMSGGNMVLGNTGGAKSLAGGTVIKNGGTISMNGQTIGGIGRLINYGTITGAGTLGSDVEFHNLGQYGNANISSGSLQVNGLFKIGDNAALSKTGAGTLTINGAQSHGIDAWLSVNGGTVAMNTNAGSSTGRKLNIEVSDGGTLVFGSTQHIKWLSVYQGSVARVSSNGSRVVDVSADNITSSYPSGVWLGSNPSSPEGKLDLTNNDLIVRSTQWLRDTTYSDVRSYVASARNSSSGQWQGNGITTSVASSYQGLGVVINQADNGQPILSTLDGESVGTNDVLVKFTWNGDANLDGIVDAADYFRIDSHYGMTTEDWYDGDFNYDGVVDTADYFLIDSAYIAQTGPLAGGGPWGLAAVPEPGTTTVLAVGLCMLAGRRRRR